MKSQTREKRTTRPDWPGGGNGAVVCWAGKDCLHSGDKVEGRLFRQPQPEALAGAKNMEEDQTIFFHLIPSCFLWAVFLHNHQSVHDIFLRMQVLHPSANSHSQMTFSAVRMSGI